MDILEVIEKFKEHDGYMIARRTSWPENITIKLSDGINNSNIDHVILNIRIRNRVVSSLYHFGIDDIITNDWEILK